VAKNLSNSWVAKTFGKPMFSVELLKQSNRSYWWLRLVVKVKHVFVFFLWKNDLWLLEFPYLF
jgi:hypothetical protein